MLIRRRVLWLVAVALLATTALVPSAALGAPKRLQLTILHNNDGESKLIDAGQGLEDYGGVARFATVVAQLKREATSGPRKANLRRAVVMLSSGDNFLAGPQFNASLEKGVPFYDSLALRTIRYDAFALGNHEFDFGPDVLADFIEGFDGRSVFLSANLDVSGEPALLALRRAGEIARSTVVTKAGWKIGIVGATTPLLPAISSPRDVEVDPEIANAIQREVDRLERRGVRIVILISHLQSLDEDLALAPELSGVDVMIAGGGDELLARKNSVLVPGDEQAGPYPTVVRDENGQRVFVITTAGDYKYVGRLVANFNAKGRVTGIVKAKTGPVRVSGTGEDAVEPNARIQEQVVEPVVEAVAALAANVVATSQVALEGRREPGVRTEETNLGNLFTDALLAEARRLAPAFDVPAPDVAIQNGGGIRNNTLIPPGPITELDTFSIAPFSNFLSVVPAVPPAQFKELLENAVSGLPDAEGRFAQVAGFRFTYDVSRTAQVVDNAGTVLTPGERIRSVILDDGTVIVADGQVVPNAPPIGVATIDFLARGGDQYPFRGLPFVTLGISYQQALLNFIEGLSGSPEPLITAADYPEGGEGRISPAP
jgi:5'-nucleotidase